MTNDLTPHDDSNKSRAGGSSISFSLNELIDITQRVYKTTNTEQIWIEGSPVTRAAIERMSYQIRKNMQRQQDGLLLPDMKLMEHCNDILQIYARQIAEEAESRGQTTEVLTEAVIKEAGLRLFMIAAHNTILLGSRYGGICE